MGAGAWKRSTRRLVPVSQPKTCNFPDSSFQRHAVFRIWLQDLKDRLLQKLVGVVVAAIMLVASGSIATAEPPGDPAAAKSEDGKYLDKEGNPTFKIAADGTVDWYTYSGYRRYHSDCHVCHGPDGMGSSYAPALKESHKTLNYGDFLGVVASGRKNVSTA